MPARERRAERERGGTYSVMPGAGLARGMGHGPGAGRGGHPRWLATPGARILKAGRKAGGGGARDTRDDRPYTRTLYTARGELAARRRANAFWDTDVPGPPRGQMIETDDRTMDPRDTTTPIRDSAHAALIFHTDPSQRTDRRSQPARRSPPPHPTPHSPPPSLVSPVPHSSHRVRRSLRRLECRLGPRHPAERHPAEVHAAASRRGLTRVWAAWRPWRQPGSRVWRRGPRAATRSRDRPARACACCRSP